MKNIIIGLLLAMLANGCIANAETLSLEQTAINTLIKKMYAIDPDTFEFAEFGAKESSNNNLNN